MTVYMMLETAGFVDVVRIVDDTGVLSEFNKRDSIDTEYNDYEVWRWDILIENGKRVMEITALPFDENEE